MHRRALLLASLVPLAVRARAEGVLRVAYAGSMGVVMDRMLGPAFAAANGVTYQGTGQGAFALARLLVAGTMQADVFVSITPGPMQLLLKAKKTDTAIPIAGTSMVIAYSAHSRFAAGLKSAAESHGSWWHVLQTPGFRFGRTDPVTDPQGRAIIFTMELAEHYYRVPDLARSILGPVINPAQIFAEPSLLTRLESGQIDASSGYRSAVVSRHLEFVELPAAINLADPALESDYARVSVRLPKPGGGETVARPEPLVFYAALLKNAANPDAGRRFLDFLTSLQGRKLLTEAGYGPPEGGPLA